MTSLSTSKNRIRAKHLREINNSSTTNSPSRSLLKVYYPMKRIDQLLKHSNFAKKSLNHPQTLISDPQSILESPKCTASAIDLAPKVCSLPLSHKF